MTNQPDGAALLEEARRALMEQLLPVLPPEQAYTARMVARAMGIAARELQLGDDIAADARERITDFLDNAGQGNLAADEHTLGRLIREEKLPEGSRRDLPNLLMELTRGKLALSNPKHLKL